MLLFSLLWMCLHVSFFFLPFLFSQELRVKVEQVLDGFRRALGAQWTEIVGALPESARTALQQKFSS